MTRAADDFALIKEATFEHDMKHRAKIDSGISARAAFNRLFSPRPLRELVAEGWTRFQVEEVPESGSYWLFELADGKLYSTGQDLQDYRDWEWRMAFPIPTPQDMGQS